VDTKRQIIKAMAVIRRPRDGALLVSEYTDTSQPPFQRPLGGHVEFGEYARDTIHREFLEELDQRLAEVRLLGVLENIFPWHGGTEHEVVFIFSAAFADPAAYDVEEQPIRDNPERRVLWRPTETVSPPLYPDGLAELIVASRPAPTAPSPDRAYRAGPLAGGSSWPAS
jgi:ADP-ribose pyrophosphatase YjhB (NUDIX family)